MFKPRFKVGQHVFVVSRFVLLFPYGKQVKVIARADGIVNLYRVADKRGRRYWLPENVLSSQLPKKDDAVK